MSIRYKYTTYELGDADIHIKSLRDTQQFEDINNEAQNLGICDAAWPLFGVVWPSGVDLANLMMDIPLSKQRILEVGCGIGLASHTLNQRSANITATDHHPAVHSLLNSNSQLNNQFDIPYIRKGWADIEGDSLGQFDVIIGSDLLYEPNHFSLLANFINHHALPSCQIIIIDPGRGHVAKFIKLMLQLNFLETPLPFTTTLGSALLPFTGRIVSLSRSSATQ